MVLRRLKKNKSYTIKYAKQAISIIIKKGLDLLNK